MLGAFMHPTLRMQVHENAKNLHHSIAATDVIQLIAEIQKFLP
jgi:hypothetical protein